MTWPDYLPAAVCVLYFAAAWGYAMQGKDGLALAFVCYGFANVGLIWASVGK